MKKNIKSLIGLLIGITPIVGFAIAPCVVRNVKKESLTYKNNEFVALSKEVEKLEEKQFDEKESNKKYRTIFKNNDKKNKYEAELKKSWQDKPAFIVNKPAFIVSVEDSECEVENNKIESLACKNEEQVEKEENKLEEPIIDQKKNNNEYLIIVKNNDKKGKEGDEHKEPKNEKEQEVVQEKKDDEKPKPKKQYHTVLKKKDNIIIDSNDDEDLDKEKHIEEQRELPVEDKVFIISLPVITLLFLFLLI